MILYSPMLRRFAAALLLTLGFTARAELVVINEIFYHPQSGDSRDEFIELYNPNWFPVNLTQAKFDQGITFAFPSTSIAPNEYLVVAADPEAFQNKYPGVPAAGPWEGRLSNGGETIRLVDVLGRELDRVSYADDGDWAVRARGPVDLNHTGWIWSAPHDGGGRSLELSSTGLSNEYGQIWNPSLTGGGTPGKANSVSISNLAPVIDQVLHRPAVPGPQDAVSVSAKVLDDSPGGVTAYLHHRVDGAPDFTVTPMFDDGIHRDRAAGDGVFGVILPAAPDKTIVEFYVRAVDSEGNERTWPRFVQPDNLPLANLLYQVSSSPSQPGKPTHRLIMTKSERDEFGVIVTKDHHSNAKMNGTFVSSYNGTYETRYQVGIRHRGQGSRFKTPNNFRVEFTGNARWRDNEKININADNSIIQVLGSAIAQNAGFLAGRSRLAAVRLNDQNSARPGASMFGYYAENEVLDSDFADENQLGSANIYRGIRTGHMEANLSYRGDDPDIYRPVYFKETNQAEDDWSDLIELMRVLSTTPDSEYVQEVNRVIDPDQWLRYFVFNSLLANSETALGNGFGDDYYIYSDLRDGRFRLIPYDHDSLLGQGDERLPPETPVFTALRQEVVSRFLTHPEFAARYYEIMLEALDDWFTESNLFPLIDQILGGIVPEASLDPIRQWITRRREFLKNAIPRSLTIATRNLFKGGNGFEVSTPEIPLEGRADPVTTASVLVNGLPAAWSVWEAKWRFPSLSLRPGINRIVVQAFDSTGAEIGRAYVDVHLLDTPQGTAIGGVLPADAILTAAGSPYWVTNDLVVPENGSLTIEPGTTAFFDLGVSLAVEGTLLAEGSASARIRMTGTAEGNSWDGLRFSNASGTNKISFLDIDFPNPGGAALDVENSVLHLHSSIIASAGPSITFKDSSLWVEDCHFRTTTNASIIVGTRIASPGFLVLTNNVFFPLRGSGKVISLADALAPGAILECYNNVFMGGEASAIELFNASAHMEGNRFASFYPPPAGGGNAAARVAVINGTGEGHLTAARNIFSNVDRAILLSGAGASIHHNTFLNAADGVAFAPPSESYPAGYGVELVGNIFSAVPLAISGAEVLPDPSALSVAYCLFPEGQAWEGLGNVAGDARLLENFHLAPGSAAFRKGPMGLDMGASVPASLSISPVPISPSADSNQVFMVWGPGFTHYKISLNGGPFSEAMDISTPLLLSNLAEGPQRLSLLGLNSAGRWQQTNSAAAFEWEISFSASPIVLNEVFAGGEAASGSWIELYNSSGNLVDLSGYSISVDSAAAREFVFPAGISIPAQGFLRISGDALDPAFQLGFELKHSGDAIRLFSPHFPEGENLVDSISFGHQLSSFSIGRVGGGWALTQLTPEAVNKRAQVGDRSRVLINEWYAAGTSDNDPDFIELLNPEPFPISLAGLGLSDHPGGLPFAHVFPPLTFMPPKSVRVFIASGTPEAGPGHLPFKLSRDQGAISLTAPDGSYIDWIWYGPQSRGISEGRPANNLNSFSFFPAATMGASNPIKSEPAALPAVAILPWDADWKFNSSGEPQPSTWVQPEFDDSSWESGKALFASGVEALPKPINTPPALGAVTFYFRTQFELSEFPDAVQMHAIIDDGAVIYLNGRELKRIGIGEGPVTHDTISGRYILAPALEGPFVIPRELLEIGTNILAVEVHQVNPFSHDVAFGLFLQGLNFGTSPAEHIRLNEILADNRSYPVASGHTFSWVELYNPSSIEVDVSGMALTDDPATPRKWVLPEHAAIPAEGYMVVSCPSSPAAGTRAKPAWASGGAVYLFARPENGGTLIDAVAFGFQTPDFSLVRGPAEQSGWRLGIPTPGELNEPAATAEPRKLKINEWLAQSSQGEDWLEIFNPADSPVDLSGLRLSEDWEELDKMVIAPYSFIGTGPFGYKVLLASGDAAQGSDEAPFKLSKDGESIILSDPNGAIIDSILFGRQSSNVSQGRYPDGTPVFQFFRAAPSPNASNYLDLDGDGLPGGWETQFGFDPSAWADAVQDFDVDGFTNLEEFQAGTNPLDSGSFLAISSAELSSDGVRLRFQAAANTAYSIQSSPSLKNPVWREQLYLPARAFPAELSITLPPEELPSRFFRVQAILSAATLLP